MMKTPLMTRSMTRWGGLYCASLMALALSLGPACDKEVITELTPAVAEEQGAACCHGDEAEAEAEAAKAAPVVALEDLPDTSVYLLDSDWTDQTKRSRKLTSFQGELVVVAMIFTHCEYACPRILGDLTKLEGKLTEAERAKVRFLLVSMDSARDTPEVLAAYAKDRMLDTKRWTLLHGDDFGVREIAAALGVRYKKTDGAGFSHSNQITLLGADGSIAHQLQGLGTEVGPLVEAIRKTLAAN